MRKILARLLLGLVGLLAAAVIALAVTGLPTPSSLSVRPRHRVSWGSALQVVGVIREFGQTLQTDGWPVDPADVWIRSGFGPRTKRVALARPGGAGTLQTAIPPSAVAVVGSQDTLHPVAVFMLDEGGSERYRLFRWEPGHDSAVAITSTPERLSMCCLDASGTRLAFSGDRVTGESDVFVMNPREPSSRRAIMAGLPGEAQALDWSPDGHRLLVAHGVTFASAQVFVVNVDTRVATRLVPEWGDTVNVLDGAWSHDGTRVYLAANANADFTGVQEVDVASGRARALTADLPFDVTAIGRVAGTDTVVFAANEDGRLRLYGLDPRTGHRWPLPAPAGDLQDWRLHLSRPRLAEVVRQADGRDAAFVLDVPSGRLERWAIGDPPARAPLPPIESLRYPTFDSVSGAPRQINVIFEPPAATFPEPWPVVVLLHGGPSEQEKPTPTPNTSMIRRAGFAVLLPNVRGSTGFGHAFEQLDDREHRQDAVRDVGALLDWVGRRRDLDASRVVLTGGSYGGYLALASLVQYSSRLRCGIDLFGISDLARYVDESTDEHFPEMQRTEFGDARDPRVRAFLDSISPVTHAERITVPVLIYQGANDPRVKPDQSRRMVARLRALGRDVRYIEASNEGHGLIMPLTQLYVTSAALDFAKECVASRH